MFVFIHVRNIIRENSQFYLQICLILRFFRQLLFFISSFKNFVFLWRVILAGYKLKINCKKREKTIKNIKTQSIKYIDRSIYVKYQVIFWWFNVRNLFLMPFADWLNNQMFIFTSFLLHFSYLRYIWVFFKLKINVTDMKLKIWRQHCMKYKLNNEINIHNHNNWNQGKNWNQTNKTSAKIESKLMHGPNALVSNIYIYVCIIRDCTYIRQICITYTHICRSVGLSVQLQIYRSTDISYLVILLKAFYFVCFFFLLSFTFGFMYFHFLLAGFVVLQRLLILWGSDRLVFRWIWLHLIVNKRSKSQMN